MIKTFNWLVLRNKCEIYLFTKEMKKKKIRQIWHLEIFHKIKCFQIEKKGNTTWCMKSICFTFQKIIFCGKIKFKKEKKKEKKKNSEWKKISP